MTKTVSGATARSFAAMAVMFGVASAQADVRATNMDMQITATANALHSRTRLEYPATCYYPPCAPIGMSVTPLEGKLDSNTATASATGPSAPLTRQTSAHSTYDGIISDSTVTSTMAQEAHGLNMSASGQVHHYFPTLDLGPSYNSPSTSIDDGLGQMTGTPGISGLATQKATLHIDTWTDLILTWQASPDDIANLNNFYRVREGISLVLSDGGGGTIARSSGASGSQLVTIGPGDYYLTFEAGFGKHLYAPGELTVNWAASASVRAVPEPQAMLLMALGLAGIGFIARRQRRQA